MHKFTFHSDIIIPPLAGIISICFLLSGCKIQASTEKFSSREGYLVTICEDPTEKDTRWAKYLFEHLKKRINDEEAIAFGVSEKDMWRIIIQVDPTLKEDFKISRKEADIRLTTSNDKQMLWLQYQLIKEISREDPRVNGSDLSPALINITDTCGTFAFDYQSIYSPTGLNPDYIGVIGLDNFDDSWGLWGHNLRKIAGQHTPKVIATINGKKDDSQFCFSSEDLYRLIEDHIIENYGEKGNIRFMIAPDDVPAACTCASCTDAGNSAQDATPAVTQLIIRLAKRFPEHNFFTTSYLSTRQIPNRPMPSNTGVFVSSIDLPLRITTDEEDPKEKEFAHLLDKWKKITGNIYIWDYINNFDDYLTPFPVLKIAQQRLQFFRQHGATGIFLNGSGYNYSFFDEMRTFVLSALLINPELSVDCLVRDYLNQKYPTSKKWLYDYYIGLENNTLSGKPLHLYGGIQESENSFLQPEKFVRFYDEMEDFVNGAKGEERKNLNKLQTALSFTRMEVGRNHSADTYGYAQESPKGIQPSSEVRQWMTQFQEYKAFAGMEYYNESAAEMEKYGQEWEEQILSSDIANSLFRKIVPTATPQWKKDDLKKLTDGTHGLPGNYHCGWAIIPQEECIVHLPTAGMNVSGTLLISFLHLPRHHIYAPAEIEISMDGVTYKKISMHPETTDTGKGEMVKASIPINLNGTQQMSIKATGQGAQIAIDEIALIP